MRKPGEPKTPGLSQEVTLAVLPRLFTEELLSELSRRNIDTNNEAKNREHLVAILKEVMVLEYKEWEEEQRCPSPEIIDITDSSKVDENPQLLVLQQSQSSSNVPTDQPTSSATNGVLDDQNSGFKISDSNVSFAGHVMKNNDSESIVCVPEVIDVDAPEKYLHGLSEIFSRSSPEQSSTLESNKDAGEKLEDAASSVSLAKTQTLTGESEVYPVMLYQTVYQQNEASEEKELPTTTEECTPVSQNGTSERETDCEVVSSESEHQRIMRVISEAKAQVQSHLAGADRKSFGSRGKNSVKMYSKFKLPRHKQTKKQTGQTTTQSPSDSQAITTHNTLFSTTSNEKELSQESSNVGNPVVNHEAGMRWKKCYVCGVCGTRASTKFNLIRHMNRKKHKLGQAADLETMASLEMTEVRETNVQFLDTDLATMEHKKRFTCDDCGYQTSQKSNLVRHKKRKHSGKTATTTKLSQEERSEEEMVSSESVQAIDVVPAGQTTITTTEQLFQEERPTEETVSTEKEGQHMQDSNVQATDSRSEKDFICVECGFQTPLKRNLLRHKRRQHTVHAGTTTKTPSQDKRQKCTTDVSPKKLKLIKKIFTCEACGYRTNQKSNLLRHKRRRHPDLALAPTTGTLSQEDRLNSSTNDSMNPSVGKNFHRCDVCGVRCSTKFNLERHKKRHDAGKPNKTSRSGSKASTGVAKSGLQRRISNNTEENVDTNSFTSVNTNNLTTNFDTNIPTSVDTNNTTSIDTTSVDTTTATGFDTTIATNVDTNNAANTIINTNNHTSYKTKSLKRPLYTCNLCEYTSAYKVTMKYHKMVHMGEKPYMCGTCGYRATRKPLLVKHMRIHTGDRPYACDLCDYRAIQKVHLNRHVKKKHGMTSAPP
ncbi:uncharacterized protein LOC144906944 [Branchiostoma floridae x Branchiostoma belcheri]